MHMSSDDPGWSHQPDDVPAQPTDPSIDADDTFGQDPWGDDPSDAFADPSASNLFAAELENVDASAWDVDTELIWGDEGQGPAGDDGGATGLDFSL